MSILLFKPHRKMTDEELMQRVARDSESAFEELYRRYARRLQSFFFRQLGGDEEMASDFTHDVFMRMYEARDTYAEGSSVATTKQASQGFTAQVSSTTDTVFVREVVHDTIYQTTNPHRPVQPRPITASTQSASSESRKIGVSVLEDDIRYDLLASNSDMYY